MELVVFQPGRAVVFTLVFSQQEMTGRSSWQARKSDQIRKNLVYYVFKIFVLGREFQHVLVNLQVRVVLC